MSMNVNKGSVYGKLTVLSEYEGRDKIRKHWVCQCSCGKSVIAKDNSLKTGNTKSCGCASAEANTKNTAEDNKLRSIWYNMKRRCDNKDNDFYPNYGGRGITYDSSWEDFDNFKKDMEAGFSVGMSLERVDVNKGYCKDNCSWIDIKDQAKNRTKPRNNSSGYCGVSPHKRKGEVVSFRARWSEDGKYFCKYFSVKKLTYEVAYKMACEYRQKKIESLGYGENHGR